MEKNQKRDYDKEPIIIEDYNSLFLFLLMASLILISILTYFYNPFDVEKTSSFGRNALVIIPLMSFPYIRAYIRARGKRKIVLENSSIKFLHEKIVIEEIEISKISEIKRTYSDIYHKSQKINKILSVPFIFILMPLIAYLLNIFVLMISLIIISYTLWIILKYLFHKIKDKKYKFRLFDAVIVFDGKNFINILPITNEDYREVRNYFLVQGLGDIQNKKIHFEITQKHDSIEI